MFYLQYIDIAGLKCMSNSERERERKREKGEKRWNVIIPPW